MRTFGGHDMASGRRDGPWSGGRGRRGLAWLAALALCLVPVVQATPGNVVRVGGDPDYPPHHGLDARGQPEGFDVEVLRAIARDQGLALEFHFREWGGVLADLERGELDVVPMFISEERRKRYLFTRPFDLRHHRLFARAGAPAVAGIEDLGGRRVAVQFGGLAWEWLSGQDADVELVPVNNEAGAVVAVSQGKADFALVPDDIGGQAIADAGLEGIEKVGPTLLVLEYAFGVTRSRPDLVRRLDAGLARLEGSDDLLRLRTNARLPSGKDNARGLWPWALGVLGLAAVLGGAAAWRFRSGS